MIRPPRSPIELPFFPHHPLPPAHPRLLKKAYRTLALQYHPDKSSDDPDYALYFWRRILDAYEVLGDEGRRRAYDQASNAAGELLGGGEFSFDESDREGEGAGAGAERVDEEEEEGFLGGGGEGQGERPGRAGGGSPGPSLVSVCGPRLRRCLPAGGSAIVR